MNQRIQQLSQQANLLADFTMTTVPGRYMGHINVADIEKFAKLIVLECAEIVNAGLDPDEDHLIGNDILEHFGVEE